MNEKIIELKSSYENEKKLLEEKQSKTSISRLLSFILAIILFLLAYRKINTGLTILFYILGIVSIIGFVLLVVYYYINRKKIDFLEFNLAVIKDYEARESENWKHFNDTGKEFLEDTKYYQNDLDIFGKSSLYQYLNVAKTGIGRELFAEMLKDKDVDEEYIRNNSSAVLDMARDVKSHIELEAKLRYYESLNEDSRPSSMKNALNLIEKKEEYKISNFIISMLFTVLVITLFILALFKAVPYTFVIIALVLNFFQNLYLSKTIKSVKSNLGPCSNLFLGYDKIISEVLKSSFTSTTLIKYQEDIKDVSKDALKSFNRINNLVSSRDNIIFNILSNSIFSFDAWLLLFYSKWQDKYQNKIRNMVYSIGNIEAILSLSVLNLAKRNTTVPTISKEFKFTDLAHPLISEKKVVPNSFTLVGLNVITGSNMSGKTTFMRTIGINYLLFKAGGSVCAKSFNASIYKLFTSMKITDDVSNGISTFYGEVLRIKSIIDYIKEDKPMLVLIDEIFRGTNTIDRIDGATSVCKRFNKDNILSIITTHDFELCKIENASNYHFLEHYENNKILFDYKIRSGVSTTKNAIYLLKMAGIVED